MASDGNSIVRFEEAERELASDIPIEMNQAMCLTNDLGAFSRRVDALVRASDGRRTKPIVLGHSKLNLYSPSGVFEDLEDLRREAKDVADTTFEDLAKFVAPVYKANASCKVLEYVACMLCELAAFEKAPDRVGSVFWKEVRKTRIVDVVYMRDLNVPGEVQQRLGESISIAVVDEAHKLPDAARQMYTETLSPHNMDELCLLLQQAHYKDFARQLRTAFLTLSFSCTQGVSKLRRKAGEPFVLTPFRRAALIDCIALLQNAGGLPDVPR